MYLVMSWPSVMKGLTNNSFQNLSRGTIVLSSSDNEISIVQHPKCALSITGCEEVPHRVSSVGHEFGQGLGVSKGGQLCSLQGFSELLLRCFVKQYGRVTCAVFPQIHLTKEPFSHKPHHGTCLGKSCCRRPFSLLAPRKLLSPSDAHWSNHIHQDLGIFIPHPNFAVLVFYFRFVVHIFFFVQDASDAVWK